MKHHLGRKTLGNFHCHAADTFILFFPLCWSFSALALMALRQIIAVVRGYSAHHRTPSNSPQPLPIETAEHLLSHNNQQCLHTLPPVKISSPQCWHNGGDDEDLSVPTAFLSACNPLLSGTFIGMFTQLGISSPVEE